MPPAEEEEKVPEASPRRNARMAGVFYLLTFLTGAFSAFISGELVIYADAANLVASASYAVVTLLFYKIFEPVDRSLSMIAAVFGLVGCIMGALGVFRLVPAPIRSVNPLVLFGCYCLLIGYLIFQSTFLPRVLGGLMAIGGFGWLTFISPTLADYLSPYNLAPGILGEGALTFWLLVFGLNAQRWREQAAAVGS